MPDRTCPRCGAPASERLKFCRDCGGRLEEAADAADPSTPSPAQGTGDETLVAGMAAQAPPSASSPTPEQDPEDGEDPGDRTVMAGLDRPPPAAEEGEEEGGSRGSGTRTVIGGVPVPASPGADAGDETIVSGLARPPSPSPEGGERSTATFVGTTPPEMAPPPPNHEREEEPVTDDFDLDAGSGSEDDSGSTLLAPLPAPPPAPPPPPRGAVQELEHWTPRVKSHRVTLEGEETMVGRDRGEIQHPDDNYLSKKHGRFYRDEEGRLCVEDLGTLNGTFIRVRTSLKLEHRDVIGVGRHIFRFEVLKFEEPDDRTLEGDPLTRVQGVQGSSPRARLVKRQEEGFSGIPFFFGTHRYVLGRTEGSHRFTRDDQMSRSHVALTYREGDYWLEDLGSQNGTWLKLRESHVLQPGDVIRMGDQYFKFV